MAHLAIVTANPKRPPAGQAHDLRNILASISLHLETLQRLSGPSGVKAADAVYALLTRGAVLCNSALDCATGAGNHTRRRRVDLMRTAHQIAALLEPSAPKDFSFDIDKNSAGYVLADPDDVFRILFNLMSNAVSVANSPASTMKSVTIRVRTEGKVVTAQVSDDGPGLPAWVQYTLVQITIDPTRLRPRHRARARGAKRGHTHARPYGQRRQLRIEARSVHFSNPAERATVLWA
jgi:signal transduction histidine kinase